MTDISADDIRLVIGAFYLGAAVLFILGLKRLSSPGTARSGISNTTLSFCFLRSALIRSLRSSAEGSSLLVVRSLMFGCPP